VLLEDTFEKPQPSTPKLFEPDKDDEGSLKAAGTASEVACNDNTKDSNEMAVVLYSEENANIATALQKNDSLGKKPQRKNPLKKSVAPDKPIMMDPESSFYWFKRNYRTVEALYASMNEANRDSLALVHSGDRKRIHHDSMVSNNTRRFNELKRELLLKEAAKTLEAKSMQDKEAKANKQKESEANLVKEQEAEAKRRQKKSEAKRLKKMEAEADRVKEKEAKKKMKEKKHKSLFSPSSSPNQISSDADTIRSKRGRKEKSRKPAEEVSVTQEEEEAEKTICETTQHILPIITPYRTEDLNLSEISEDELNSDGYDIHQFTERPKTPDMQLNAKDSAVVENAGEYNLTVNEGVIQPIPSNVANPGLLEICDTEEAAQHISVPESGLLPESTLKRKNTADEAPNKRNKVSEPEKNNKGSKHTGEESESSSSSSSSSCSECNSNCSSRSSSSAGSNSRSNAEDDNDSKDEEGTMYE